MSGSGERASPLAAEFVLGGALNLLHARLTAGEARSVRELGAPGTARGDPHERLKPPSTTIRFIRPGAARWLRAAPGADSLVIGVSAPGYQCGFPDPDRRHHTTWIPTVCPEASDARLRIVVDPS